jgi:hypothetical protein
LAGEEELGGRLIERLVSDPGFREEFRRDPARAARRLGLDGLADEMLAAGGDPLQTLAMRESRSSLAGVMMAAAAEGVGISELVHGLSHPASASAHDVVPQGGAAHVDPAQYGMQGSGGPPSAETPALLDNHHVTLDADGIADLRAGRIDPRIVSVLTALSQKHTITVSAMCSDHPQLTAGGSVSNHWFGRAMDIATVDGQPVGPGNAAAKQVALELGKLSPGIRPTEIGSPWAIADPAYFSDAAHQNHLHVGFDDPIAKSWQPPGGNSAVPAAAPAAPAAEPPAPAPDDAGGDGGDDPNAREDGGSGDTEAEADDESDGSDGGDGSDDGGDDPNVREDGGSGDTEAEADDESDGDDSDDADDAEDGEDSEDGGDSEEADEDEDEPDETGPEGPDVSDGDTGESPDSSDDGSDSGDSTDGSSDGGDSTDGSSDGGDSTDGSSDGGDSGDAGSQAGGGQDLGGGAGGYPGDDADQAQIAAWMSAEARKRGLPGELPVMAALVESGMSNLDHGDADSVGYFQMRLGIWNSGDYAGYPDDAKKQLDWFLDHAVAVRDQRVARGLPVDDSSHYGEWIADVERPAAQYRGRYQLRLAEAQGLLERAAGGSGDGPRSGGGGSDVVKVKLITPEDAAKARGDGSGG